MIDIEDVALGHEMKTRSNPSREWIVDLLHQPVHEPLVDGDTFEQYAQS